MYVNLINKAVKLTLDNSVLVKSLKNIATILRQIYFAKNIDNLLVQLVDTTYNEISTFTFHFIPYYITTVCSMLDVSKLVTILF